MNKLIIVCDQLMKPDERERTEEQIKHDLERNGFVLLDNRFKVYEINDSKEE